MTTTTPTAELLLAEIARLDKAYQHNVKTLRQDVQQRRQYIEQIAAQIRSHRAALELIDAASGPVAAAGGHPADPPVADQIAPAPEGPAMKAMDVTTDHLPKGESEGIHLSNLEP